MFYLYFFFFKVIIIIIIIILNKTLIDNITSKRRSGSWIVEDEGKLLGIGLEP